jgi:HSP20 family protein
MNNTPMTLWRNTWSPANELRRELDSLFDWSRSTSAWASDEATLSPACDVQEEEGNYLLSLEVPGMAKEDIKIETLENQIVVSGERKFEAKKSTGAFLYSERRFGKFRRVFALPAHIDAEKVEAHYQDGVLRVLVPKAESSKARQVKITNGNSSGFLGRFLGHAKDSRDSSGSPAESRDTKLIS